MKSQTRFTVLQGWKIILADMGINPSDVLTLAGLPADLFAYQDTTLSAAEYFAFWEGLEKAAGDEKELPLKLGQAISVEAFDPPIFASLCSDNLNTALARLSRFKRLIGPMKLTVTQDEKGTTARIECVGYEGPIPKSLGAAEMVFFTKLARLATRQNIVPAQIKLVTPPNNIPLYTEYLGVEIEPGDYNEITFTTQDAEKPFLTENTSMWEYFEPTLRKKLADLDTPTSITERVRNVLLEMIPSGTANVDSVAKKLLLSKRSLQRKLADENTNFKDTLNGLREELARHYLAQPDLTPTQISFLLGFEDPNSFFRAFQNWTGTTPNKVRADSLH